MKTIYTNDTFIVEEYDIDLTYYEKWIELVSSLPKATLDERIESG